MQGKEGHGQGKEGQGRGRRAQRRTKGSSGFGCELERVGRSRSVTVPGLIY